MKKLLFLLSLLATVSCDTTERLNPKGAQFNSRGCLECDNYSAGESFIIDGNEFLVVDRTMLDSVISVNGIYSRLCVSKVNDMSNLFKSRWESGDISNWDVSNVTNMSHMFEEVHSLFFYPSIGDWDVSNVTNMSHMFHDTWTFHGYGIQNWDVSNVTDMESMFEGALSFIGVIGNWDVSNVTNMSHMFEGAFDFNHDLSDWCVSNFSSIPANFSYLSALTASNHPVWGTCP